MFCNDLINKSMKKQFGIIMSSCVLFVRMVIEDAWTIRIVIMFYTNASVVFIISENIKEGYCLIKGWHTKCIVSSLSQSVHPSINPG